MIDNQAQQAFDLFASQYDTMGDKWQDMGADQYFIAGYNAALKASAQREAQVRAEEREKVEGLVEALQNIAKDTVIVYGWNENHKKVPMGTKQTAMAVYASNVLATYNDNRKG